MRDEFEGRCGMDGSNDPIHPIAKVLRKHVDRRTLEKVIDRPR